MEGTLIKLEAEVAILLLVQVRPVQAVRIFMQQRLVNLRTLECQCPGKETCEETTKGRGPINKPTSNRKLLGTKGIATRSNDATRGCWP